MTIFDELQAAGLPVISADESGAISMNAMTTEQRVKFQEVLLQHFQPTEYADLLADRTNFQQWKNEYLNTVATLQQIEDATSPTNAQVVAAVKFLAKTVRIMLKLLVRRIVNA